MDGGISSGSECEDDSNAVKNRSSDRWECFICHDTFAVKGSLTRHLAVHRAEKPHKCQFCDSCFRRPDHLYAHHKSMHPTELLTFECDECHEVFNTKTLLRLHKTEHVGAHQCEFCGRVFTKKQFLTVHKKIHTGDRPYTCEYCSKSFTGKYFLKEHMKRHTIETPFKCEICDIYFQRESCLRGHHTKEHLMKDNPEYHKKTRKKLKENVKQSQHCDICNCEFEKASDFWKHQKEQHGGIAYECETCGKILDGKSKLLAHQRLHMGEQPFVCETCGKRFRGSHNLRLHERVHSGKAVFDLKFEDGDSGLLLDENKMQVSEDNLVCPICQERFDQVFMFEQHLSAHANRDLHVEEMCKARADDDAYVPENIASNELASEIHIEASNEVSECEVCSEKFQDTASLATHLLSHAMENCSKQRSRKSQPDNLSKNSEESTDLVFSVNDATVVNVVTITDRKYYECDLCHKQFTTSSYLNVHKRAHSGIKPFTCDFCGKQFTAKCNLKVHVRLHTGEKPYNCEVCNKRFSDMSARNSHRRSHFSEKPYPCDTCDKSFSQKHSLNIHRKTHSEERTAHKCEFCDQFLQDEVSLNCHKQIHINCS